MTARWRALPATTQDVVLALLLGAAWFGCSWFWQGRGWSPRNPDVHVLAGGASVAALAVRRSAPAAVLAIAVLAYPFAYDVGLQTEFHLLPVLVVAYVAGRHDADRAVLVAVACLTAGFLLSSGALHVVTPPGPRFTPAPDWSGILFDTFAVGSLLLLGAVTSAHRRTAATLTARNAELEALRRVEAERAVAGERTRIARELHDDVAHHLTALIVRAQAAERVAATRPEVAVESVGWIAETARHALTSVRQTVSVLHADAPGAPAAPVLRPGPSLADLPALVARVEDAGVRVALVVDDRLPALDARAHHAAVRIVQESLTNVLRHARARRVTVSVRPAPGAVAVTVEDDGTAGRPPADARLGHGVLGMQERARSCGGRLAVDVGELGGWRVRAWIPALDAAPA